MHGFNNHLTKTKVVDHNSMYYSSNEQDDHKTRLPCRFHYSVTTSADYKKQVDGLK